jgi:hypothetical protein
LAAATARREMTRRKYAEKTVRRNARPAVAPASAAR